MMSQVGRVLGAAVLPVLALAVAAQSARADTLVAYSLESRMQIDLAVPDGPLKALIPAGWEANVATQGPAKDANIRLIFVDQVQVAAPDGKPLGRGMNQFVFLQIPVKQTVGGQTVNAQLVVGGISADPVDVPGGFGVYTQATEHKLVRTVTTSTGGKTILDENWSFTDAAGQHFEISVGLEHVPANRAESTPRIYGPDGKAYQQLKQVNSTDIAWNITTLADRLTHPPVLKVSGKTWAKLFDGTEKILSVDYQPWFTREISIP
ncbi:MAG: hypothetical protein U1E56_11705 [Bauldia sp.]|mgnify:CR=1 FL=1